MSSVQHDESTRYLPELAAGDLDGELARRVSSHVEGCADCRDWLDTYQLLAAAATSSKTKHPGSAHPSSEVLASLAVDPATFDPISRDSVLDHLMTCHDCSNEIDLCRGALATGDVVRSGERGSESVAWSSGRSSMSRWQTSIAAGLTGLALAASLYFAMAARFSPDQYLISNTTLRGNQTIRATEQIAASRSQVDSGARITLRAKEVVLGDGFTVDRNAVLVIESAR